MFSADGRDYRWDDVLAAAAACGDWEQIRRRAAAERPPADHAAVNTWRRRCRLLSADETVAWLEHWCLELADLERHLGVRAQELGADLDRAAWVEAVCSGAHRDLARALAARVALAPSAAGSDPAALDEAFQERKQEIERSGAVADLIAVNASDWVRVRLRRLILRDVDAAREAVLCLRVDGMSLDEVATIAGTDVIEGRGFLDELDAEWRAVVSSAAVGELCGPVATGAGYAVMQLLAKDFDADDPAVMARARKAAVDQAIAREAKRFTWHEQL